MDKTILETVHESAKDLYEIGLIDATTMREFDSLCLQEVHEMKPQDIKEIRIREKVSQPVLARYLNVSPSSVKHWERGEKHPSGPALKLLNLVAKKGLKAVA
jgi:putative transcriptional regulator